MHSEKVGAFRANRTEKVGAFRANKTKKKGWGGALPRHIPTYPYCFNHVQLRGTIDCFAKLQVNR